MGGNDSTYLPIYRRWAKHQLAIMPDEIEMITKARKVAPFLSFLSLHERDPFRPTGKKVCVLKEESLFVLCAPRWVLILCGRIFSFGLFVHF